VSSGKTFSITEKKNLIIWVWINFNWNKMRKALETTEHPAIVSTLILSAHNPFRSGIPHMGDPENLKKMQGQNKDTLINSCFRNIFYSKQYGEPSGIPSVDTDRINNGAEHLVYISDRLVIPMIRERVHCLHPQIGEKSEQKKEKLRKILNSKTGFIDLVNEYEEK